MGSRRRQPDQRRRKSTQGISICPPDTYSDESERRLEALHDRIEAGEFDRILGRPERPARRIE